MVEKGKQGRDMNMESGKRKKGWHDPGCQFSKRSMDEALKQGYEGREVEDNPKELEVLGYCPVEGCGCSVTDADYVKNRKMMLRCVRCGNIVRKNRLKVENPKKVARNNGKRRKNYLDRVVPPEKHRVFGSVSSIPEKFKQVEFVDKWD